MAISKLRADEDLVIDGETVVCDLAVAGRVADMEMAIAEANMADTVTPSKQTKTLDEVNAEMSSDSEDEKEEEKDEDMKVAENETVSTSQNNSPNAVAKLENKQQEEKSELDKILALNNLEAVLSDDEEELTELQFKLPVHVPDVIGDNVTMLPLGTVQNVISKEMAVVQSKPNSKAVDVNAVVVTKDRKVVGMVIDTFGTVKHCMYSVALTESSRRWVAEGLEVYAQEDSVSYVFDTIHDEKALRQLEDELSDDYSEDENENKPAIEDTQEKEKPHIALY